MTDQQERIEEQRNAQRHDAAQSAARQAGARKLEERMENPKFFEQLRDADLDTDLHSSLEDVVGPESSGAHVVGNRAEEWEREIKWLDQNRGERLIVEGSPGRLCKDPDRLALAQKVHGRDDRQVTRPRTMDERRAIRGAMRAVTSYKSLGIENTGLRSLTELTSVSRVEKNESEEGTASRVAERFR